MTYRCLGHRVERDSGMSLVAGTGQVSACQQPQPWALSLLIVGATISLRVGVMLPSGLVCASSCLSLQSSLLRFLTPKIAALAFPSPVRATCRNVSSHHIAAIAWAVF